MVKLRKRDVFFVFLDVLAINGAFLLTIFLHFESKIPADIFAIYLKGALIVTILKIIVYRLVGLYNIIWKYASVEELIKILVAVSISSVVGGGYLFYTGTDLYLGVYLTIFAAELLSIMAIRFGYRLKKSLDHFFKKARYQKKILIVGTGSTAALIATEIKNHSTRYGEVVGFIDEDDRKLNKVIAGIKILGNYYDIGGVVYRHRIDEIILASPTADPPTLRMILEESKRTTAKVRIIPGVDEIIDGQVSLNRIRDVGIEDLLGREEVNLNVREVIFYLEGKTVMVTGGGGSIGSELCRQIARFNPKKLIILDNYENNAYNIQNELSFDYGDKLKLDVIIATVRDREEIFSIIDRAQPDIIFHAAAHKHVPLMERVPSEAIKNNVFGTRNVAEAAHECGVSRFVMVSTDKAVNPTNIMGASKRICELIIQGLDRQSKTKFTAVRFGNVLGSNGSVVPLFKKQIKEGGPVTVTHKDIIRYFMTIPEAAQLVIQSGAIAKGGEVFVLEMGRAVKIYDLAVDLIKLSGLKLNEDIEIEIIGLRPGEKLYEELMTDEEGLMDTRYEKIRIGKRTEIDYNHLKEALDELTLYFKCGDRDKLMAAVKKIVPNYRDSQVVNEEKEKLKNPQKVLEKLPNI